MELLKKLYSISAPSRKEKKMKRFIKSWISKNAPDVTITTDNSGNIYAVKGIENNYPCFVAHLDEVCPDKGAQFEVITKDDKLFGFDWATMTRRGLGGDDKNGIYIILQLLQDPEIKAMKAAFFIAEEIGCIGSNSADVDFFDDVCYIIEPDRRNGGDLITCGTYIDWCSNEFLEAVKPYTEAHGYSEAAGLTTDVNELKYLGIRASCINISCGYYRPHTNEDYTLFNELLNALELCKDIAQNVTDIYNTEQYIDDYSDYFDNFEDNEDINKYYYNFFDEYRKINK